MTVAVKEKRTFVIKKEQQAIRISFLQKRNQARSFLEIGDELFKQGKIEEASECYRQAWSLLRA